MVAMTSKALLCDCSATSLSASLLNISSSNRTALRSNSSYCTLYCHIQNLNQMKVTLSKGVQDNLRKQA